MGGGGGGVVSCLRSLQIWQGTGETFGMESRVPCFYYTTKIHGLPVRCASRDSSRLPPASEAVEYSTPARIWYAFTARPSTARKPPRPSQAARPRHRPSAPHAHLRLRAAASQAGAVIEAEGHPPISGPRNAPAPFSGWMRPRQTFMPSMPACRNRPCPPTRIPCSHSCGIRKARFYAAFPALCCRAAISASAFPPSKARKKSDSASTLPSKRSTAAANP